MTGKFRRAARYATVARYAVAGLAWWVQHRSAQQMCERCGAVDNPRTRPAVVALVDEYFALRNAVTGIGEDHEMRRKVLELLAAEDPFTVTVLDPTRERN